MTYTNSFEDWISHAETLIVICSAAAILTSGAAHGWAQGAEELRMTVGKSVVIDYPSDIRQISTSNPDVVDASPVTRAKSCCMAKASATPPWWCGARPASAPSITSRWT